MNIIREILHRLRKKESLRAIAKELHLSRNTVKKYRFIATHHGYLNPEKALPSLGELGQAIPPPAVPRHKRSTVEPYAEFVKKLVEAEVEMKAIWQRLMEEHGYTGSYSSLRRFIQRVHPRLPEAVCRVETAPGEESQVDFGSAGLLWDAQTGKHRRVWVFVMTLCWSRHQYIEFVYDQRVETWLACHEHAFAWFGGVVQRVVLDNLKAGVLQSDLHDPVLCEAYRRFAQHYGFVISPNRPRTPQHKGKVESGVHYVKRNFLSGQVFTDLEAMNQRGHQWVLETAGQRQHGTTKEAPLKRFYRAEQKSLLPLPQNEFELLSVYQAKVQQDCHVHVDSRYYSVPYRLIGKTVAIYISRRMVEIYLGTELVATHPRLPEKGGRSTRIEHYPESKQAWIANTPERCRERAKAVGVYCTMVVDYLLNDSVQDRRRCVQSILRLGEQTGLARLEKACHRAIYYNDPSYRRIKKILDMGLDQVPMEETTSTTTVPGAYQFARPASTFFSEEAAAC